MVCTGGCTDNSVYARSVIGVDDMILSETVLGIIGLLR